MEIKLHSFLCVFLGIAPYGDHFTTIFNFNEFIFVYVVNIRFICDGEIYLLTYLLMSERGFTRSVPGLGPNHVKADCRDEAIGYKRLTDIEVSEATYNCKLEFIEILVFTISFNINNYLVFLHPI